MPQIQLAGYRCARCGHEWVARSARKPTMCPRCKSPYWDRERERESKPAPKKVEAAS